MNPGLFWFVKINKLFVLWIPLSQDAFVCNFQHFRQAVRDYATSATYKKASSSLRVGNSFQKGQLWTSVDGKCLLTFDLEPFNPETRSNSVHTLAVLPDGQPSSGQEDGTVRVWRWKKSNKPEILFQQQKNAIIFFEVFLQHEGWLFSPPILSKSKKEAPQVDPPPKAFVVLRMEELQADARMSKGSLVYQSVCIGELTKKRTRTSTYISKSVSSASR